MAKCDNCKSLKGYTTGADEYPQRTTIMYCSKDHWDGGGIPDENQDDPWADCEDFENKIDSFTGNFKKRLPEEIGKDIRYNGKRVGESESVKDSYWSGYEKDGKYYISLNDSYEHFWEVSHEDLEDYCL